ncbi:hypothetical protein TESG_03989 [Trichophyton tonsurans CBS 112818]|uniref:STEEP1 domain-containing protein n=1 Tax=Trichophyton tonsurans (strain CBS 112818) TaxID=647933 RepID=F2RZ00_TRIT1|nr:hypothetical protein TESG_03989 [Trichophyton tonsurans CBS 112818]
MATTTSRDSPARESPTPQQPELNAEQSKANQPRSRIPIRTYHCRFCNHLLVASTQDLSALPRRRAPALDNAIILPLPKKSASAEDEDNDEEEEDVEEEDRDKRHSEKASGEAEISQQMESATLKPGSRKGKSSASSSSSQHYTILLSTTTPDRKPIILRRADGFEKRLLVRCGRCKVVLGYVLDEVHFKKVEDNKGGAGGTTEGEDSNVSGTGEPEVIYILPGSLVETEQLGTEIKIEQESWAGWESLAKKASK